MSFDRKKTAEEKLIFLFVPEDQKNIQKSIRDVLMQNLAGSTKLETFDRRTVHRMEQESQEVSAGLEKSFSQVFSVQLIY